ncbi:MAG TPA: transposase [Terriglobia bacterium]|nr:transposase [Terriglobia bacterium]
MPLLSQRVSAPSPHPIIAIMKPDRSNHHRRSIRLKGHDYSQPGAYYLTICTFNRDFLFGDIVSGQMRCNGFGQIAQEEWWRSEKIRRGVEMDAWVVMPNHVHGILMITQITAGTARRAPTMGRFGRPISGSLPTIIGAYKSAVSKRINEIRGTPGGTVWQREYYEHVVRNDDELNRIREYIATNPLRWPYDPENPATVADEDEAYPWEW